MSVLATTFGQTIRQRRRDLGMTQAQVAEMTGKKQSQIVRLEHGLADPRLSSVVEVSLALGMEMVAVPIRLVPAVRRLLKEQETGKVSRSRLVGNDPEDAEDAEGDDDELQPRFLNARLRTFPFGCGQTLVGSIVELANDRSVFEFDEAYVRNENRPVLSLSIEGDDGALEEEPIMRQMKLAPFFSNLLPEGALRKYVAERAGVKSVRDLPLLRLLGEDLPGAVIVRAGSGWAACGSIGRRTHRGRSGRQR